MTKKKKDFDKRILKYLEDNKDKIRVHLQSNSSDPKGRCDSSQKSKEPLP